MKQKSNTCEKAKWSVASGQWSVISKIPRAMGRAMNEISMGSLSGLAIAFAVHSVDPSLISQLIAHYPFA